VVFELKKTVVPSDPENPASFARLHFSQGMKFRDRRANDSKPPPTQGHCGWHRFCFVD
jgi:hypothetical protein